ncbi:DUF4156 domain-containing protein [Candidatus Colwellia aromaticivorans]|uniref:DUF4156 domain-containing protein n=1 Tax=Candidatus Colwellia aromaticivorans TaxID=2267621 RepID=UPI001FE24B52|nr:DUF4156 domain-containing protein [Candidatus Colwellia aromaticivorans]
MIPIKIKYASALLSCLLLPACSMLEIHQLHDKAKVVKLFDDYEQVKGCRYIGEIVGSEGSWYNYLFISNKELTLASINDLKNQANAIGANNIHVHYNLSFNTSVTFLAQAYHCK